MDILTRIKQHRLGYFGHVVRIDSNRYSKIVLYRKVHGEKRSRCMGKFTEKESEDDQKRDRSTLLRKAAKQLD